LHWCISQPIGENQSLCIKTHFQTRPRQVSLKLHLFLILNLQRPKQTLSQHFSLVPPIRRKRNIVKLPICWKNWK
jgi:hypothetical protein